MVATFKAKRDAAYEHGRVLRWFWAAHVGVEPEAIRLQRKSNSNQLNGRSWRSVHGVRTVTASDTYLRARVQAWIAWVRERGLDSISLGV